MHGDVRVPARSIKDYGVMQTNQDKDQQGIEHIREAARSVCENEVVQVDVNQQGVEHIREAARSVCHNEVVQVNEDVNEQGIKHIQDRMLSFLMYAGGAQANEEQNQQEIEHIRGILLISYELLKLVENEDLPGKNKQLRVLKC